MSHWNYRVVKHKDNEEEVFSIFEVYYNDDGSVYAYTEEPKNPVQFLESPIDIAEACGKIAIACAKPVLTLEELESMVVERED